MNNGAVNRHENGGPGGGPVTAGALVEGPEAVIRISGR
jgi:hypothetical protein